MPQRLKRFVRKYSIYTLDSKGTPRTNVLYDIASPADIASTLVNAKPEDGMKQRAAILHDLYKSRDHAIPRISIVRQYTPEDGKAMADALQGILNDNTINGSARTVTRRQLEALTRERGEEDTTVKENLEKALDSWRKEMAHKQWVSFQDSVKVIASRIPAQSMQSFMAMKVIAWTKNKNNMCYVSHIQFFLQGSDLDIDKAYIMTQNYDSSGTYIGWSPYFDYTSLATLEASKNLPVPKGVTVRRADSDTDAADLMPEIEVLNTFYSEPDENHIRRRKFDDESDRLLYLKLMRNALLKLEHAGGKYKYNGDLPDIGHIEWAFRNHESYQVNKDLAEGAYKNVASSNIYAISHDIRNRDHAYTPTDTSAV